MPEQVSMVAPYYVLGELELDVESLSSKSEVLSRHGMPDIKELWGWGQYRKTQQSRVQLAVASAAGTLERSGLKPSDIDALIVCCSSPHDYLQQNAFSGELTSSLGIGYCFHTWVGGAACASLFAAVEIGRALVQSGSARHVLVVSVDKLDEDADRFQRFAVLSDASCSFILGRRREDAFDISSLRVLSCPAQMRNGGEMFQEKCELIHAVFRDFESRAGRPLTEGCAYFGANVFTPIQELEMSALPVQGLELQRGNAERYGHCYAADPLINLVDFYSAHANRTVRRSLLASTAHGHFAVLGLERS